MTSRGARSAAWGLWMVALVFDLTFLGLVAFQLEGGVLEYGLDPITALYALFLMAFPTLGALIASQRPKNVIGWLFCVTGALGSIGFAAQLYADRVLYASPDSGPAGEFAAWISMWAIPAGLFIGPIFLLYLFPEGSPGSGWRRRTFMAVLLLFSVSFLGFLFRPGALDPFEEISNPVAIGGAAGEILEVLETVFQTIPVIIFLTGVLFVIVRFRSSHGALRQQMKWFAYPASLMGIAFGLSFALSGMEESNLSDVFFLIGVVFLIGVPICSTVAILRYRLYEIDVIVNRTLVYAVLTATLAAGYLGSVVVLQTVIPIEGNDLAVVASTLTVAALFRPLRGRVQAFIDHRFYRNKYDAAATLDDFGARLRDEVDLGSLQDEIVAVVAATMRPAHASVWLRERVSS